MKTNNSPALQDSKRSSSNGLLYVTGYGRSGSTLLDTLLGNHDDVFGAGELRWLFDEAADDGSCSCGQRIHRCEFWRDVLDRISRQIGHDDWARAAKTSEDSESIKRVRPIQSAYIDQWCAVYEAIRQVSGRRWIVDSSKLTRSICHRLALIGQNCGEQFRVVHLVRDPRAIMWSTLRGSNRRIEAGRRRRRLVGGTTRGLVSWMLCNLYVEYVLRRNSNWPVSRVRYEDLVSQPEHALKDLGQFLNLDMASILARIDAQGAFAPGHGICGNRMRRGGQIVLRLDREWEERLPRSARWSSLMAWPLMKKYDYRMAIDGGLRK